MRVDLSSIRPGETIVVAGKWWGLCMHCGKLVRIDKPILGSAHFCVPSSERGRGQHGVKVAAGQRDGDGVQPTR